MAAGSDPLGLAKTMHAGAGLAAVPGAAPNRVLAPIRHTALRWLLPATVVFVYLYSFPYFAQIHNANELPRVELTQAIAEHGHFYIDEYNAREPVVDVAGPLSVDAQGAVHLGDPHGHVYANKAPGQSFLGVPFYFLARWWAHRQGREPTAREVTFALRLGTATLPTLLFLPLLWALLGALFPGADTLAARRLALAAYALGTMALQYSVLLFSHQLSAACVGAAYALVALRARGQRSERAITAAGFLAAAGVVCDYQAVFAAAPVFVYALVVLAPRTRVALRFCLGALAPAVLLLAYHTACFGRPWRTGYSYTIFFEHFHSQGFLGLRGPRWEAFWGSTFAPDNGLFVFSPVLLLAIPGLALLFRRRAPGIRADAWLSLFALLFFLYFVAGIAMWRGGWEIGPRYITVALPFLVAPLTAAFLRCERSRPLRATAWGLSFVGIVVYVAACATFPLYQDDAGYRNPLFEVTFRLVKEGWAPYDLGHLLGLHGGWCTLPLWLGTGALLVALAADTGEPRRRRWISAGSALGVMLAVLAGYSLLPRATGDHALRSYDYITRIWEPRDPGR